MRRLPAPVVSYTVASPLRPDVAASLPDAPGQPYQEVAGGVVLDVENRRRMGGEKWLLGAIGQ